MSLNSRFWTGRKVLLWVIVIPVALLILFAVAAGMLYGERIKQLVVDELNTHLLVKVDVAEIDFTVLRSFPNTSVELRNVSTRMNHDDMPELLHARSISLRFGIFSLFTGNYNIQKIVIDEAAISMFINLNGEDNFHIWKPSEGSNSETVNFDIREVLFKNVKIYYRDLQSAFDLSVSLPDFNLNASKRGGNYQLALNGDIITERIRLKQKDYGFPKEIALKLKVRTDDLNRKITFDKSTVAFPGINVRVEGVVGYATVPYTVNLKMSAGEADLSKVLANLPDEFATPFSAYEISGLLDVNLNLDGRFGKDQLPLIASDFKLSKGSLFHKNSKARVHGVKARGTFTALSHQKEQLVIEHVEGMTQSGNFKGKLIIAGFKQPLLDLSLNARLNLSEIAGFIPNNRFEDVQGHLTADVVFKGTPSNKEITGLTRGSIVLENTSFKSEHGKQSVNALNARLELGEGYVYVDNLSLKTGNTDLKLKGRFQNLMEQFFFNDKPLYFDAELVFSNLDVEDLLAFAASEKSGGGTSMQLFEPALSFDADVRIGKLKYRKFSASEASGKLNLENQVLKARELYFKAMDGTIKGNGLLNMRYQDKTAVLCEADFRNIDIQRLFYEFNNFGQSSLKSTHLKGRGDVQVNFSSLLNSSFDVNPGSVNALADIEIRNGELINFEPMQELSRFLDAAELRNVKFSTLKNRIEVVRERVIIPEMDVKSSVMNLKGYGAHTFGNEIDYHLNVLLSELVRKKSRRQAPEQAIQRDEAGNTRLFLHLLGTVDKPEFRYDSQAVVKKITDDFKNQKQELRNVLREEFGKRKNAPPPQPAKGVKFDIEWDEDK